MVCTKDEVRSGTLFGSRHPRVVAVPVDLFTSDHRHQHVHLLDALFGQLPKDFSYAVEIRNAGMLGSLDRDMLASHGVAHVYNHWSYMPSLAEQHQKMGSYTAPFTVLRLLTPLKMSYEAAKRRAEPYDKIVGELPDMRKEALVLIKDAIGQNRRAYVLVNNRLEGNAPLTVQALTDLLRDKQTEEYYGTVSAGDNTA